MSTVSPDGGSLRAFVILFLLSFRWTRKIEMLYSFNFVFGPQMGSTTVRLGGGVTGAARSTHATEQRAATCVSRNGNASILIIWTQAVPARKERQLAWLMNQLNCILNCTLKPLKSVSSSTHAASTANIYHSHSFTARRRHIARTVSVINAHASGRSGSARDKREIISSK